MREDSLLTYMIRTAGFRKARRVFSFLVEWAAAREALKLETMTVAQFAEFWKVSHRKAFYEQSCFWEVLGHDYSPDEVVDMMLKARGKNPASLRWHPA